MGYLFHDDTLDLECHQLIFVVRNKKIIRCTTAMWNNTLSLSEFWPRIQKLVM